jgi:hypothetical protein
MILLSSFLLLQLIKLNDQLLQPGFRQFSGLNRPNSPMAHHRAGTERHQLTLCSFVCRRDTDLLFDHAPEVFETLGIGWPGRYRVACEKEQKRQNRYHATHTLR